MTQICTAIIVLVLTLGCQTKVPEIVQGRPLIGVKIYETKRSFPELFDAWHKLGVNTVFAGAELASAPGFRAGAKEKNTDFFVIFPIFFAPDELAQDPELWAITADGSNAQESWVEFVCPSRVDFRAQRIYQALEIVKRLQPDGLSIDFIRNFVFWEMVKPDHDPSALPHSCYCKTCLRLFEDEIGADIDLENLETSEAASWIMNNAAEPWVRFQTNTINSMAEEIVTAVREVKPDILINIHIVPWRTDDYDGAILKIAGQDRSALGAIADYLSPMAYSFMLYQPPGWVASVVKDVAMASNCAVVPSIQVGEAYRAGEIYSAQEFEQALRSALLLPSAGVVFWSWDHIEAHPDRAEIIRRVIREES